MGQFRAGYKYPLEACTICGDELAAPALRRHEERCRKATPQVREELRLARLKERGVRLAAAPPGSSDIAVKPTPLLNNGYHGGPAVTDGPRLVLTLSIDFETLRQLLPHLSLDGATVR